MGTMIDEASNVRFVVEYRKDGSSPWVRGRTDFPNLVSLSPHWDFILQHRDPADVRVVQLEMVETVLMTLP